MLIRWILTAVGLLQQTSTSPLSNRARKASPETAPEPETQLEPAWTDDDTAGDVSTDETLLDRLRAAGPDDVLTIDVDELVKTLKEHAAYSELFKDTADAENARADYQAVAQAVADGDLTRVFRTISGDESALRAVESFQTDFQEAHPQAYGKFVQDLHVSAIQSLEQALSEHPDPEMQGVARFPGTLYSKHVLGVEDYRQLVEDPALAQRRKEVEAEREQQRAGIIQRDRNMIWANVEAAAKKSIESALRECGVEPSETKVRHAFEYIMQQINADQSFLGRMERYHQSARRAGFYPLELTLSLSDAYSRSVAKEMGSAMEHVIREFELATSKPVLLSSPDRTPAGPARPRSIGFRLAKKK